MRIAKIVLAGCAALTLMSSAGLAQQATTGTGLVTIVDRLNDTVAIRPTQDGTVGASDGGAAMQFKATGLSLENVHAGDRVKYSATEAGGTRTLTRIEKQ